MTIGRIPSVEGGIQPTIFDAKADILTATAADTPARLAVGANNTVLTADSSTATGLKWATPSSGGMTLLSTTTLSGSATTISGISGSYIDLVVYIYGMTSQTASYFRINPNGDAGLSTYQGSATDTTVDTLRGATIYVNSSNYYVKTTGGNNAWVFHISNYASTAAFKPFSIYGRYVASDDVVRGGYYIGGIATTSAITSLEFNKATDNFTGGTVLIYGVK